MYHVGAGCHFHNQDEKGIPKVAAKKRIAYPHVEVEDVCCHEQTEQSNPHRIVMNLQTHMHRFHQASADRKPFGNHGIMALPTWDYGVAHMAYMVVSYRLQVLSSN